MGLFVPRFGRHLQNGVRRVGLRSLRDASGTGYPGAENEQWAFYPLYPLLARTVALGVAISTIGFWIGLILISLLTEESLDRPSARRAVWFAALYPASFFDTAYFAEGLFLALSAGAFLAARRMRPAISFPWASLPHLPTGARRSRWRRPCSSSASDRGGNACSRPPGPWRECLRSSSSRTSPPATSLRRCARRATGATRFTDRSPEPSRDRRCRGRARGRITGPLGV